MDYSHVKVYGDDGLVFDKKILDTSPAFVRKCLKVGPISYLI